MRKLSLLITLFSLLFSKSFSQKNYFYGSIKVPIADYIKFLIDNNTDENYKTDGALFSIGYGLVLSNNLSLEAGLQAFAANPIYKRYNQANNTNYNELIGKNQAVFIQLNPYYKIDLSDSDYLKIGCSLNYGKLFSKATYYKNTISNNQVSSSQLSTSNASSKFLLNSTPFIGATFFLNKDLALGFDFEYVNINWSKSMNSLSLAPILQPPVQKTNNIFLSGKIIFK